MCFNSVGLSSKSTPHLVQHNESSGLLNTPSRSSRLTLHIGSWVLSPTGRRVARYSALSLAMRGSFAATYGTCEALTTRFRKRGDLETNVKRRRRLRLVGKKRKWWFRSVWKKKRRRWLRLVGKKRRRWLRLVWKKKRRWLRTLLRVSM